MECTGPPVSSETPGDRPAGLDASQQRRRGAEPEDGAPAAGERPALISIYRCDSEMRISEIIYSDHIDDPQQYVGGIDHDWLPAHEADMVLSLKRRAVQERRLVRETFPITWEGRLRTFRFAVFPEREPSPHHRVTVVAVEILDTEEWLHTLDLPSSASDEPEMPAIGSVRLDNATRMLLGPSRNVHLSGTEWRLVRQLTNARGSVVSHEQLLSAIWGSGYSEAHHLLHDAVSRLRQRFQAAGVAQSPIETVHGVGYRLRTDAEVS